MSVELDPVELGFRRPFTQEVEEKLRLHNPNSDPIVFKVKTTAPKQYCVRPNSGRIEAGQDVEVSVLLQAMKEEPPLDAKCRDKFLVQSIGISASDEFTNVAEIWSTLEQNAKGSIQEKKIRVNFLPASGVASTPNRQSTGLLATDDHPPAYSSPMSNAPTPQHAVSTAPATGPVSKFESRPENASNVGHSKELAGNSATPEQSTIAAAPAAVAAVVPTSVDELKAQLAEAQKKISTLTQQASEGLRQRKAEATKPTSTNNGNSKPSLAMQQAPGGVPVPLVAALCLLSFLIAYLLF